MTDRFCLPQHTDPFARENTVERPKKEEGLWLTVTTNDMKLELSFRSLAGLLIVFHYRLQILLGSLNNR